ncbi:alpha/beta hydrolase [Rhizobium sp. S152]|uniref:alpha/beta fold hydrolase n=1 Tax=Rhizobium sp. S152 TaxID=3055038 RepID=UPI0025A9FEED|nr:alpha/beta hydrolase [Rhizobium sp. S152]MDM9629145.1 alpha/beta hydrolase [Rhizobium sp. S152]
MTAPEKPVFRDVHYASDDGLTLHARDYDPEPTATAGRPAIVCLPGLTRNCRDFHPLAIALSRQTVTPHRVVSIDYRGRGLSDWDRESQNYNLAVEAGDVVAACRHLGIDRAIFIGTSRGGLIVHLLAERAPEFLVAAILNDIGPELEPKGLMRIRDYLNTAEAPANWREAVIALKMRHLSEFPALSDDDWREMAEAIFRDVDGMLLPDFDPAIAAQLRNIDFARPLPDLWPQYARLAEIPLMLVKGENSDLISETTIRRMETEHPGLSQIVAGGQGHAPLLHLEPILGAIRAFIATI